jgi:hypothetical protein
MASIYESPDQQVQLTGSQTGVSFQPGTAFDPSRQMLQQSERDLGAFAQFSDLLSRTLVERAKENNENQKNLGIADIVNGRMTPSQSQLTKYNNDKALLQTANDSTQQVINEVRTTNPDLAETMYQEAPAATGWRAYGQAIGMARKAASGLEAFMSDFMAGTDLTVPGPDGVLFAPARAKTRAQLEASWEVGIQQYAQRAGLGNLNPVIIAAELTPIAMRTRSEMLGMQMQQIITTREANEREDIRGSLPQQAELIAKDPAAAQNIIFDLNNKLLGLNRENRGKTNAETNEMMEGLIRILNDRDPALAGQVKQHYYAALINPNNPSLGTYGQRFSSKELTDLIQSTTNKKDEDYNKEITTQAEGIVAVFYSRRNPANYRKALAELGTLPQTPEVRAVIEQLVNNGPDYDPQRAEKLGEAAVNLKELDALKTQGAISTEIYDRNSNRFAEEKAIKDLLPPDSAIKSKAKDYLKRLASEEIGRVPEYFDNASALAVEGLLQYAKATVEAELKSGKLEPKGGAINSRIEDILEVLAPDFLTGDKKNFLPSPKNPNLKGAVVRPAAGAAGGQNGRYLVDLVQSRVPRVTSAVQDISISPERWRAAYDVLESGGKAPADVSFAAKTAGVSVPEFLRVQASKVGETYDANAIQRGNTVYQENKAVSPRLAELIANPRTTPRMRDQYQVELQRLKQNQGTPLPTNERWMNDLGQLPQSQGTLPLPPPDGGEPMEIPSGGGGTQARAATRSGGGMTGITTYYTGSGGSDGVAGGPTANGEPYNPNAMTTAVQRSLRGKYLNKWLLVEDLDSGKSVRVWANDVGSMGGTDSSISRQDPRIIDLSPAAFKQLYGNLDRGTGRIRVRIDPNQRGKSPSSVR